VLFATKEDSITRMATDNYFGMCGEVVVLVVRMGQELLRSG